MRNPKGTFEYVVGIVGHPTTPDVAWSDEQLQTLKDYGINTLQLAIAWASKPANEVLNLEDLDEEKNFTEWQRRAALAEKFGFRALAHFGLPMGPQEDVATCISDPRVLAEYAARLRKFLRDFPTVNDILIYTYDQHAWLCSEFGACPRCGGVPLHERVTPFLEGLVDAMRQERASTRLWWEPWELSAGQTFAVTQRIRPENFGLILHHTIAEVQFTNTTDLWFRNLARLAGQRGIPVIGEGFFGGSGEDVDSLTHLPCPRLVYQQLRALHEAEGVVGAKEYYGLVPSHFSVNAAMLREFVKCPDAPLEQHLRVLAAPYQAPSPDELLAAWESASQAMELFPWDASWNFRRTFSAEHRAEWAQRIEDDTLTIIPGASWQTPAWQANRRGFYLVTDETVQHPWMREDVGLRAQIAGETFASAASQLRNVAQNAGALQGDLEKQSAEMQHAAEVSGMLGRSLLSNRSAQ